MDQIHHLAKVRVDYVLGAKWLLRVRLLPTAHGRSVVCPATSIAASGSRDVLSLAEERDRRQQGTSAIRCALREPADRTSVPIPEDARHEPVRRVFTCLYRAGRRGIVREPEGIETLLPGKSSERAWSKG